jgi:hypothetical protein
MDGQDVFHTDKDIIKINLWQKLSGSTFEDPKAVL